MISNERLDPDHDMIGKDALMEIFRSSDSSMVQELALRLIRTEKELLALRKAFSEPVAHFSYCHLKEKWLQQKVKDPCFEHLFTPLYRKPPTE